MLKIKCLISMPLSGETAFVYRYGIQPAIKSIGGEEYEIEETDGIEDINADNPKFDSVIEKIKDSDFVLVDLTENRPIEMLILGYCEAISKPVYLIRDKNHSKANSISLLGTKSKIFQYEATIEGTEKIIRELPKKIVSTAIKEVIDSFNTLRSDKEIDLLLINLDQSLRTIEKNSIVKNLAKKEVERLGNRVIKLEEGQFELRNKKPQEEIIDYYSDYVAQLDEEGCKYDTISYDGFWKEITNNWNDERYLKANLRAANSGTQIRRVFLIEKKRFDDDKAYKAQLKNVLTPHFTAMSLDYSNSGFYELRTNFFQEGDIIKDNYAIWSKKNEFILFKPVYQKLEMQKTDFTYSKRNSRNPVYQKNHKDIKAMLQSFEQIWQTSQKLNMKDPIWTI